MTQRKEKLERFGLALNKLGQEALSEIQSGKTNLTGKDGVLTPLIKRIIEASLDTEMEVHLDSESEAVSKPST